MVIVLHCPRLDRHGAHEYVGWSPVPWGHVVYKCPGSVTIEGGALTTHDCGARVHPAEIHECRCGRCVGTLCPECEPCRRVS